MRSGADLPLLRGAARRLLRAVALVVAAVAAVAPADASLVESIEVRADVELPRAEIEALVNLRAGAQLTMRAARETLRNLHATGRFDEIELWTRPAAAGDAVVAIVALRASMRVEAVTIEGETGVGKDVLAAAVVQKVGQPLVEDRVLRSATQIEETLRSRGYLRATARVRVDTDLEQRTARVTFAVAAGARATVAGLEIAGDTAGLDRPALERALGWKVGDRYSEEIARDAGDRLRRHLRRESRALAVVDRPEIEPDEAGETVRVRYPVDVGPRLDFSVEGADRKRLERKGLFPFLGEEGYDEALVLQAIDEVRRHFQELGHYDVQVVRSENRTAEEIRLVFTIEPGAVWELEDIRWRGNATFPATRLEQLLGTSRRRALQAGSGRLVDTKLEDDLANLRSFYALEGFGRARIGPPVIERRAQKLILEIPIEEGPRAVVESLSVRGAESLAQELGGLPALVARLPLAPGGPYHSLRLQGAVDTLRALYEDRGYDRAQISPRVTWDESQSRATVSLDVFEGLPLVVDRVVLRGHQKTKVGTLRAAVGLAPGTRVSSRRLLEAQRRLYSLGLFSRVEVGLTRSADEAGARDLMVRVEEGKTRRLTYSVGYESEDGVRGLLGYSQLNLWGRAASLQIDARASRRTEQFRALLVQPTLGRFAGQTAGTVFTLEEQRESFTSRQTGGLVQFDRIWREVRAGVALGYRLVDLELASGVPIDNDEITREQQAVQIASLTPNIVVDRRDDPIEPTRGFSFSFQAEEAFPLASATEEFSKLFLQGTGVLRLGRAGLIAASLRFGGIEPRGDEAPPDALLPADSPSAEIPISERFFGGGRTTHRAYARDLLGIRGETLCRANVVRDAARPCRDDVVAGDVFFPAGGNGLALVNVDWRFPLVGPMGGVLFVDGGNVWADWRTIDPRQAKWGAGVGVRYLSPIGPLRAEIGWKLDREPGESAYEVRISFGNPF